MSLQKNVSEERSGQQKKCHNSSLAIIDAFHTRLRKTNNDLHDKTLDVNRFSLKRIIEQQSELE